MAVSEGSSPVARATGAAAGAMFAAAWTTGVAAGDIGEEAGALGLVSASAADMGRVVVDGACPGDFEAHACCATGMALDSGRCSVCPGAVVDPPVP